ncbi:Uncharacterized conserved protein, DUF1800 family [Salinihabitans flavidus]|uniref:Uncharacterized conserved protein, DUF1800 family n=2 Tax=Salinihabitans flavidus TaxID=569882 RepID=A0A1H8QSF3_9RHOB|nr:Uncharacterized conserved protein, DUF1800 family [Salinihabitans flavidus]
MVSRLAGEDEMGARFPIPEFSEFLPRFAAFQEARKARKAARRDGDAAAVRDAQDALRSMVREVRRAQTDWARQTVLRRCETHDGFRERLVQFWGDHFTARGKAPLLREAQALYVEESIRPHVSGRFGEMLYAVVTSPLMLHYLDQNRSFGPNSAIAQRKPQAGLNENLARELLELHTLGVDGSYGQNDVRALAELLTGLRFTAEQGFRFHPKLAEPGQATVLGKRYGGPEPALSDIRAVLDDLVRHPATARHIARKLAVHFVADQPDPALVAAMAARFSETEGDLIQVYEAMLSHPAAWRRDGPGNVKQPLAFVTSGLRALGVGQAHLRRMDRRGFHQRLIAPMEVMGQPWQEPEGPDGWAEADSHWITPQGMAARLQWAMAAPRLMLPRLPDPRDFVEHALGSEAPETVRRAAGASETRWEGVGLVLISPAFQRHG